MTIDREKTLARFWRKVNKTDTCWLWIGSLQCRGYGRFSLNNVWVLAHRFVYEAVVGPIPEGLTIDHLCRVRRCVNPSHMEPVTMAENTLRGFSPPAINKRKTVCDHGHPYTPENTMRKKHGRRCRICHRTQCRLSSAKRRAIGRMSA